MNAVFLRDSTGVSDSIVMLFGGALIKGGMVNIIAVILSI
jgi:hypothetical protein